MSISVDLFKLTGTERDFVFGLIDQIQNFDSEPDDEDIEDMHDDEDEL